jgi:hypothetical protein
MLEPSPALILGLMVAALWPAAGAGQQHPAPSAAAPFVEDGAATNEETQGWTVPALRGVPLRTPASPQLPVTPGAAPPGTWEQDGQGGAANEDTRGWTWPGHDQP